MIDPWHIAEKLNESIRNLRMVASTGGAFVASGTLFQPWCELVAYIGKEVIEVVINIVDGDKRTTVFKQETDEKNLQSTVERGWFVAGTRR